MVRSIAALEADPATEPVFTKARRKAILRFTTGVSSQANGSGWRDADTYYIVTYKCRKLRKLSAFERQEPRVGTLRTPDAQFSAGEALRLRRQGLSIRAIALEPRAGVDGSRCPSEAGIVRKPVPFKTGTFGYQDRHLWAAA